MPENGNGKGFETSDNDLHSLTLPLEVLPASAVSENDSPSFPKSGAGEKAYSPERQRDYVRLIVTCGLLTILAYLVIFATVEATSYPAHWQQTKELLQILLPALTGIIGTVIGFYFGTQAGKSGSADNS